MSLLNNLVSYWKLDETSGNAIDSHGSNTLTANGSPSGVAGKIGNAANLDSSSTFLRNPSSAFYPGIGDFSFSGWFRLKSTLTDLGSFFPAGKYDSFQRNNRCWGLQIQNESLGGNYWRSFFSTNGTSAIIVGQVSGLGILESTRSTTDWHHWTVVRAGTTLNLYIDGLIEATGTVSGSLFNAPEDFRINGMGTSGAGARPCEADECGYWSRGLTASEVAQLYNSGSGLAYPFGVNSQRRRTQQQIIHGAF